MNSNYILTESSKIIDELSLLFEELKINNNDIIMEDNNKKIKTPQKQYKSKSIIEKIPLYISLEIIKCDEIKEYIKNLFENKIKKYKLENYKLNEVYHIT